MMEHFAYLEDVDIGYRAKLHGYRNLFCPTARVLHVGSGTSARDIIYLKSDILQETICI